jgi:hypothetical protein
MPWRLDTGSSLGGAGKIDMGGTKIFVDFYSDAIRLGLGQTIEQTKTPYPKSSVGQNDTYQMIINGTLKVEDPDLDRIYIV